MMAMIALMEGARRQRGQLRPQRFDLVLTATLALMAGITVVLLFDPDLSFVIVDRSLDVAVTSLTSLSAAVLGALALLRYRESARLSTLLQACAFATLAITSGTTVTLLLLKLDGRVGLSLGHPEQLPLFVSQTTRLTIAALFLAGGIAALRSDRVRLRHARFVLVLPTALIALATALVYPLRDRLPLLITDGGLKDLVSNPQATAPIAGVTGLAYALVSVTVVVLLAGAVIYRFAYTGNSPVTDGFLSIALVIAAFAEIQYAFYPGVYSGLVTTGDALRLASFGVLLLGIHAELRADLRALRRAYASLDRLRLTEAERAALEERSRLAREIHDGLAQHLWFAKLKFERLSGQLPEEARPLSAEVGQAIDSAIVEARQAMVTMRTAIDQDMPLSDMISRAIDDFGQRSGIRVEYLPDGLPNAIPPRQQIELLRIMQEALTNVRKHADATVVRVRAEAVDGTLLMSVGDNGRGFDPALSGRDGLGLQGMEERARLMGGQLRIESAPSDGTIVELTLPLMQSTGVPGVGDVPGGVSASTPPAGTPVAAPPDVPASPGVAGPGAPTTDAAIR
jgi:signal transduction histidine kinase